MDEPIEFDELVDVLRDRPHDADALNSSEIHSFKTLLADGAAWIPEGWYLQLFEELEAQGHIGHSANGFGFDANARLRADGRFYVREQRASA